MCLHIGLISVYQPLLSKPSLFIQEASTEAPGVLTLQVLEVWCQINITLQTSIESELIVCRACCLSFWDSGSLLMLLPDFETANFSSARCFEAVVQWKYLC